MLARFLFVLFFGSQAIAAGPVGDLFPWAGEYEVTKCIQCPDHKVEGGANLKNFRWFGIGVAQIPEEERLPCAQTDIWVGFSFNIESNDGTISSTVNHGSGQCSWGNSDRWGSQAIATSNSFEYTNNGSSHKFLSIKKIGANSYELYKKESSDRPSWGYPKNWEYRVEARKVD